jgi:hypothetical protein
MYLGCSVTARAQHSATLVGVEGPYWVSASTTKKIYGRGANPLTFRPVDHERTEIELSLYVYRTFVPCKSDFHSRSNSV